jgi:hypothetical protein
MFRDGVNPLRCAVRATRKPRVAFHGHPFDACVSPMGPSSKPSLVCTPHHMTPHLETWRDDLG